MQEMQYLARIPEYVFLLAVWHVAFFWKFYRNPNLLATSEVLSTFYPHWTWLGRQLRAGRLPFTDSIYYKYPVCIPFLSTFYPPYFLTSLLGGFRLYTILILGHYLIGSFLAFAMLLNYFNPLVALFGALSLVYNAYNIKLQTPCFAFTSCWIMGMLIPGWFGALCFGMAILSGYWPILLVSLPILYLTPTSIFGAFIGLFQIVPFLWYFPKSSRARHAPTKEGKVPFWRFFVSSRVSSRGIHYPEYAFGLGLCLLMAFVTPSIWWIFAIIAFLGTQGLFVLARIPARFLYLLSFSLVMATNCSLQSHYSPYLLLGGIILQCFLLWKWRDQYPHFPFSQWWRSPDYYFSEFKESTEWPYFSGYMFGRHQMWYKGDFRIEQ